MPRLDGTGPQGRGPMTGRSMGFCVLKESKGKPGQAEGFVGIQGMLVTNGLMLLLDLCTAEALDGASVAVGVSEEVEAEFDPCKIQKIRAAGK